MFENETVVPSLAKCQETARVSSEVSNDSEIIVVIERNWLMV